MRRAAKIRAAAGLLKVHEGRGLLLNGVGGTIAALDMDDPTDPRHLQRQHRSDQPRPRHQRRRPRTPREIAYFNPPAQVGKRDLLRNSAHAFIPVGAYSSDISNGQLGDPPLCLGPPDMTADWCMSPPRFDGDRLWVSCDDNGSLLLRFTNHTFPLA